MPRYLITYRQVTEYQTTRDAADEDAAKAALHDEVSTYGVDEVPGLSTTIIDDSYEAVQIMTLERARAWASWFLLTNGGKDGEEHDREEFSKIEHDVRRELIESGVEF